eukprot:SAG11_NODE_2526_length_3254_cov_2.986371_1_plen_109_part_00
MPPRSGGEVRRASLRVGKLGLGSARTLSTRSGVSPGLVRGSSTGPGGPPWPGPRFLADGARGFPWSGSRFLVAELRQTLVRVRACSEVRGSSRFSSCGRAWPGQCRVL